MTNFLSDKIIDDQGNVKTIASGQDARLYYIDINGERKKYLLDGEAAGEGTEFVETDPIFTAVSGMFALKSEIPTFSETDPIFGSLSGKFALKSEIPTIPSVPTALSQLTNDANYMQSIYSETNSFQLTDNTYYIAKTQFNSINYSFNDTRKNAAIVFQTGDSIFFNFTIGTNLYINKPFDIEPNTWYIIAQDMNVIIWTKLEQSI